MPNVQFSKVKCTERAHTRRESWSPTTGLTCSVELMLDWEDRYKLIADLAGSANGIRRGWPYTADTPEVVDLVPVPVDIAIHPLRGQHYTQGCQGIDYATAIATVTYKTWTPTRERVEFQTQNVRLSPKLFNWSNPAFTDDGLQPQGLEGLSQTLHRIILIKEFDNYSLGVPYNLYGTEDIEFDGSSGYIGTIHNKLYASTLIHANSPLSGAGGYQYVNFKANTLLMLDPVIQEGPQNVAKITPEGQDVITSWRKGYRFKFRWLFRPEGHNKFWRPEKEGKSGKRGSWESIELKGTGEPYEPFPPKDHFPFLQVSNEDEQKPPTVTPLDGTCPIYTPPAS